jgi:hypothetical protein
MSSVTERLILLITADTSNAVTSLDKLGKTSETSLSGLDKLKGAFAAGLGLATGAAAINAVAGGLEKLAQFGIDSAKAAEEDARGQKLLESTIRNTTSATAEQIKGTDAYISKLALSSTIMDEQLRPALATLTRSTGDLGSAQKLLNLSLDVSAGTGADLGTVSEALSKAVQGNTKSLRALTPELGKMIREGASANDIFTTLSNTYRGQSKEFADNNSFGKLSVAIQEAKETIGKALLPAVAELATVFADDLAPAAVHVASVLGDIGKYAHDSVDGIKAIGQAAKDVADPLNKLKVPDSLKDSFKDVSFGDFITGSLDPIGSLINKITQARKEKTAGDRAAADAASKLTLTEDEQRKTLVLLQNNLGSLPPYFQALAREALGSGAAMKFLATDADGLAAKLAKLSFSGVESQMFGNVEAQAKFNQTIDGFTKVTATAGTSAKDYERKLRGIEDADRSLADAQQELTNAQVNLFLTSLGSTSDDITRSQIAERESTRSLADAQRALGDAQKRLNDLRNVDAASALDAQANYIQAQRDFVDAERSGDVVALDRAKAALIRTQEALNKAQDPSIGVDVAKAQQDVQAAQDGVTRAALDQKQAQQDLNDVLDAGKKGSKELGDANKQLEDAQRKVEDASRSLGDAQDALITSTGGVTGATKDSTTKFYEGLTAASSYLEYLRNNKAPADEIAKAIGEIETKLGGVASEAGKTGEFDAYIGKLRDVQGAYDDLNRTIDNGPWSGHQGPNGGNMFPPTPNDLARAAAGDVGIGISVTVKGTGVVDALLDYQSKNGSIPIRVSG